MIRNVANIKVKQNVYYIFVSYIDSDDKSTSVKIATDSINSPFRFFGTTFYLDKDKNLHRENGPAVEDDCGIKLWFLNGKEYSIDEYWRIQINTDVGQKEFAKFFGQK